VFWQVDVQQGLYRMAFGCDLRGNCQNTEGLRKTFCCLHRLASTVGFNSIVLPLDTGQCYASQIVDAERN
jgi:hypothetical protein